MKNVLLAVFVSAVSLNTFADAQDRGGGDLCENRIQNITADIKNWISKGGAAGLNLPGGISHQQYSKLMTDASAELKINCVGTGDEGYPVEVSGTAKVCRFDRGQVEPTITCDLAKFSNISEADQYVLIHHEIAGIAGLEKPNDDSSVYEISNQISGYLEDHLVKRLAVKPAIALSACGRSTPIALELQKRLGKVCTEITGIDLLTITNFQLSLPTGYSLLAKDYDGLNRVRVLVTSYYNPSFIESGAFKHTPLLEQLQITAKENTIPYPEDFLVGASELKSLHLRDVVGVLPRGLLKHSPKLDTLALQGDFGYQLDDDVFSNSNSLWRLTLSSLDLSQQKASLFQSVRNLRNLTLIGRAGLKGMPIATIKELFDIRIDLFSTLNLDIQRTDPEATAIIEVLRKNNPNVKISMSASDPGCGFACN
ncbi:MAG: hypothetical protein EOP06_04635 [Proteobacteria bacterium]|nr:MAG: hypothetical protein EOP06_04635 [Pseudomonadota bacterium]